ncbi:MAG: hypothetical protein HC881_09505, partial [Leptolyngbyaceae cyanobacterium SL_7_1]|nr:hypothetical protein [Leptolyngbyaceae cyanobacterium SL_7_1]
MTPSTHPIATLEAIDQPIDASPSPLVTGVEQTLACGFERSGIGLHSGIPVTVRVLPEQAGRGRYFVRVDQPDQPEIPAQIAQVSQTLLSTELAVGDATVRTVEHLLAALVGMGIDNARIELDGAEVPLLDGSAWGWVEAIAHVGVQPQAVDRPLKLDLSTHLGV